MKLKSALIDLGITVVMIGVIFGSIYAYAGVYPPMVVVVSNSMLHDNMGVGMTGVISPGDIVLVKNTGSIITTENATLTGYSTYGDYGDVVVYRPLGEDVVPIIHRAVKWVESGTIIEADPEFGIRGGWIAPHDGFLTKGDNNNMIDQESFSISHNSPVREEWILGVARGELPWLGILTMLVSARDQLSNVPTIQYVFMLIELAVLLIVLDVIDRIIDRVLKKRRDG